MSHIFTNMFIVEADEEANGVFVALARVPGVRRVWRSAIPLTPEMAGVGDGPGSRADALCEEAKLRTTTLPSL
jgi:hypothetical protein